MLCLPFKTTEVVIFLRHVNITIIVVVVICISIFVFIWIYFRYCFTFGIVVFFFYPIYYKATRTYLPAYWTTHSLTHMFRHFPVSYPYIFKVKLLSSTFQIKSKILELLNWDSGKQRWRPFSYIVLRLYFSS